MSSRTHFWQTPWRFSQSLVIVGGVVLSLLAVQLLLGGRAIAPQYPANRMAFAILSLVTITAAAAFVEFSFVRWLGGLHLSLACGSLITIILILSTLMPSAPSGEETVNFFLPRLHLAYPHRGWSLAGCLAILFVNVAAAMGRRIRRFQARQLSFLVLHGGILLAMGMAMCATSEMVSLSVKMSVGGSGTELFVNGGKEIFLPAKLRLASFDLENYPPKLALVTARGDGRERFEATERWCAKGESFSWGEIEAEILEFLPSAIFRMDQNGWESTDVKGACPAAFVLVKNTNGRKLAEGWVSCGGPFSNKAELPLGIGRALVMIPPSPSIFRAEFQIVEKNGRARRETVVVNRPLHIGPWWVYLTNYDVGRGAASRWAGFQIVNDPTLKYVYAGLAMILAGTFWILWFRPDLWGGKRT
jgi:hypothetical protein